MGVVMVMNLHKMAHRKWFKFPALEVEIQIKEGIYNVQCKKKTSGSCFFSLETNFSIYMSLTNHIL